MVDVNALIDPEIGAIILKLPAMGPYTLDQIPAVRAERIAATPPVSLSDRVERTDYTVPGRDGPDVVIRVHRPVGAQGPLPCVYWMHGGGFIFGTYAMDDARFDRWCPLLDCVGVSVEYRLAPETPYPGPMEDAYAGLDWVYRNAAMLGVDPAHIGIGGGSAGAGLAAGLALLVRDRAEIPITFQLLIYPMLDDRRITPSSGWEVPVWSPASNELGWRAYLGELSGGDVPIYAAPARATDLSGLPPTFIVVGSLDGFLDEDIAYAQRLLQAGVPVDFHVLAGGTHGFDSLAPATPLATTARTLMEAWLQRRLRS